MYAQDQIRACLYDVLGQDNHRYFIGIVEHKLKKRFLAPILPVRIKATGMLVEPAKQVEQQRELKQKVLKEVLRQLENGQIHDQESDQWYESALEAVEACLYQPVMSCHPAEME